MNNNKKVQTIFTRKHYINIISSLIIWLSGVLFIIKFFEYPFLKIVYYSIIFFLLIFLIEKMEKFYKTFLTKNLLFLLMLIMTAAAIVLYRLDYVGYPPIAGFLILCLIIFYHSQGIKITLIQLTMFLLSPVIYSELLAFSGLFALSVLAALSIYISDRFLQSIKLDWKFFLLAFLFGITVSAHLVVGFIYLIYLLFAFRSELLKGFIFGIVMTAVYIFITSLENKGYISVQVSHSHLLSFIPIWLKIFLLIITIYVGWIVADLQEVLFASGVILFVTLILSFVFKISQVGWSLDVFDFSLAIIAIPFLILSLKEYRVDRFLGKVLADSKY